jgi:SAM-dependent methyltransferase
MTDANIREKYADTRREWDGMYDAEADTAIWGEDPAAYVVEDVAALWRRDGAKRILALPCGDGRNILPLVREFPGIVAADASRNALKILERRLARTGGPAIRTSVENLFGTSFADAEFDAVLTWDVLSHLTTPVGAVKEMLRVLAPGGTLVLNFFADDDENIRDDSMTEVGPNELVSKTGLYYRAYGRADVEELAAAVPSRECEIKKITWDEQPHQGYREYVHTHKGYVLTLRK